MEQKFCRKCHTYLGINNFHRSKSKSYPDGHITTCKVCIKNKIVNVKRKVIFIVEQGDFIISFD